MFSERWEGWTGCGTRRSWGTGWTQIKKVFSSLGNSVKSLCAAALGAELHTNSEVFRLCISNLFLPGTEILFMMCQTSSSQPLISLKAEHCLQIKLLIKELRGLTPAWLFALVELLFSCLKPSLFACSLESQLSFGAVVAVLQEVEEDYSVLRRQGLAGSASTGEHSGRSTQNQTQSTKSSVRGDACWGLPQTRQNSENKSSSIY